MEPKLVRDLMSEEVATLTVGDQLSLAQTIMHLGRIRHMPIVDDGGHLVGIVSQRDLFRGALAEALAADDPSSSQSPRSLRVEEVMTADVQVADPRMPLEEAARLMSRHKIGCLPVVVDRKPVGILTEGDFVSYFARNSA